MTLNVTNCSKCGRLMVKGPRALCPNCLQEIEEQYKKCLEYLREHRGCTIVELSEATGVSVAQITKFIREGRISVMDYQNLTYDCEVCGAPIREGHMCDNCRKRLLRDLEAAKEDKPIRARYGNAEEDLPVYLKDME
jgi:flagellar operon protein (TIGR03826 family)